MIFFLIYIERPLRFGNCKLKPILLLNKPGPDCANVVYSNVICANVWQLKKIMFIFVPNAKYGFEIIDAVIIFISELSTIVKFQIYKTARTSFVFYISNLIALFFKVFIKNSILFSDIQKNHNTFFIKHNKIQPTTKKSHNQNIHTSPNQNI